MPRQPTPYVSSQLNQGVTSQVNQASQVTQAFQVNQPHSVMTFGKNARYNRSSLQPKGQGHGEFSSQIETT